MNEQPQYYRVEPISVKPEKELWDKELFVLTTNGLRIATFNEDGGGWDRLRVISWLRPLDPEEGVWMTRNDIKAMKDKIESDVLERYKNHLKP